MNRTKRLIWQLYPSYLLITLISLLAVTWYASDSLKNFFLDNTAADLQARARLFEKQITHYTDPLNTKQIDLLCKQVGKNTGTRFTVILPSGLVVGDSENDPQEMDNHLDRPEVKKALLDQYGKSTRYSLTSEKKMMYVAISSRDESHTAMVIRSAITVDTIDTALRDIQIKIAFAGLIIALLAAAISLIVSRKITRPIEQIRRIAESIARGEFRTEPLVEGAEEIEALSGAIDQMASQLHERINTIIQQRNEIEAMLSSMVEGVIAVDMEERILSMNEAASRMFVCDPENVRGRSIQEVVRNSVLQGFVRQALNSSDPMEKEITLYAGGEMHMNVHGNMLLNAENQRIGVVVVLNDVTRLRKLEDIRREFVANVSHEIKTPITAIKGAAETLQGGPLEDPSKTSSFLEMIRRHADRLEEIVEDLLSLSRIEQETENKGIKFRRKNIRDILESAIQVCESSASPRQISIELSCEENLVANINAPLLEQALVNLIDNAIKYSKEGSSIKVQAVKAPDQMTISVTDEGKGIPQKYLSRLFERFYRVDNGRSRDSGGTGLGLAIVKHIAQAHGGRVEVISTPGEGSTFFIHLPIG